MSATIYKLTDANMQTRVGFQWQLSKWRKVSGEGDMCSPGWLHCYDDPRLAVILNPIHANILQPRLFKGEARGKSTNDGCKWAYSQMRITEEMPLPEISREVRIRFAIYCAQEVLPKGKVPAWDEWAEDWLSGKDRSARAAAEAAYWAAAEAAERALAAAAYWAAAEAAYWAAAEAAAERALAAAAYWAAAERALAAAAYWAAAAKKPLDLIAILDRAIADEGAAQ